MTTLSAYPTLSPSHTHHRPGGLIASCLVLPLTHQTAPHVENHTHQHRPSQFRQCLTPTPPNLQPPRHMLTANCPRQTRAVPMIQRRGHTPKVLPADYAALTRHTWSSVKIRQTSKMLTIQAPNTFGLFASCDTNSIEPARRMRAAQGLGGPILYRVDRQRRPRPGVCSRHSN